MSGCGGRNTEKETVADKGGISRKELQIPSGDPKAHERKIIVLGIDGIDWAIIDRLLNEGKLPAFKRIIDGGVSAPLLSAEDFTKSPALWTTICTGRPLGEHGIEDFTIQDPKTGDPIPVGSIHRTVPAIWNIFTLAGLKTDIFGMWATYPAEAIEGCVVSDRCVTLASKPANSRELTQEIRAKLTYPPALVEKVLPNLDTADWVLSPYVSTTLGHLTDVRDQRRFTFLLDFSDFHWDDVYYFKESFQEDYLKAVLGFELLASDPPQLYFNYFRGTDVSEHFFWRYLEPELFADLPGDPSLFANLISSYYEYMDEILGRHLQLMNPEDSLIILSDHGQIPDPNLQGQINWSTGTGEGWPERSKNLFAALGFKWSDIGVEDGLDGIKYSGDWGKNALALELDPEAAGMPLDELRAEVTKRIENMLIIPSEKPIFKLQQAPDDPPTKLAFVLENLSLLDYSTRIRIGDGEFLIHDLFRFRKRSGNHRQQGVFIGYGPDFKMGVKLDTMSILDVAPLLLALFDLPRGSKMPGHVPVEALRGSAVTWAQNQKTIAYEKYWKRKEGTAIRDDEFVDQLKALGYLQ